MGRDEGKSRSGVALGVVFALTAVIIWAGWVVATRASMTSTLRPLDIALLRFGAPALLLAPVWLRTGVIPRGASKLTLLMMTIGWGAPFALLSAQGMRSIEASLFAILVPGMMPIFAAIFSRLLFGERFTVSAWIGLALIGFGAAAALGPHMLAGDWASLRGAPYLLAASIFWAGFAIAFRRSGLGGVEAAGLVGLYSTILLVPLALATGTRLTSVPTSELLWQIAVQGLLAGVVSVVTYNWAIARLGPARAGSFSALVPVLAALGGVAVLGETLTPARLTAVICASLGVAVMNGAGGALARRIRRSPLH